MLRVTVEIVPHGDESRKRVLSKLEIANLNTNSRNQADYRYFYENEEGLQKVGGVYNFDRDEGHMALLARVLANLGF